MVVGWFSIECDVNLKFIVKRKTKASRPRRTAQQSVCVKSISFFETVRVKRSSSAAASFRTVILSSGVPFSDRGDPVLPRLDGDPGEPVFLFSSELKKFANTPSPPAAPAFSLPSIFKVDK